MRSLASVCRPSRHASDRAKSYTFTQLANFGGSGPIFNPQGDLISDPAGNIYGTGSCIFELPVTNRTPVPIAKLNSSVTGADPYAGLLLDKSGNLYGTAYYGGADGYGTIFELPAGGRRRSFSQPSMVPTTGKLSCKASVMDSAGNLYGTTSDGGASNDVTVFELPREQHHSDTGDVQWVQRLILPVRGLTFDAAGNLFGTTNGVSFPRSFEQ